MQNTVRRCKIKGRMLEFTVAVISKLSASMKVRESTLNAGSLQVAKCKL